MTIDKQALREAAEKATRGPWEMERENIWFTDEDGYTKHLAYVQQGDDVDDKQDHYNTAFIAAANPATMLALLDELDKKQQYIKLRDQENEDIALTVGKLRVELEAAKKRIAELEKGHQEAAKQINSWRRLAKQNIAERGKDISELEAARQRITEMESKNSNLRTIAHEQNELAIRANLDSINDAVEMDSLHKRIEELEAKLSKPVLLPKTNGYWTEQEKAYEEAITLAKRQVRLAGFNVEEM
ncbi:ead/Ea22-like family protein [Salmonella enterica subsp. enterica serovar Eastbourne]|nr:ead/Ea22-like family protein [Salmonella enterica subsp. enterica serovar Eastbourne]EHC5907848.1 ead/Ea22-like family protein [Salmonella enterica subsp. enterica serovar Eastbourne]